MIRRLRVALDDGPRSKGPMKLSNPIGRESFSWTPWPLDESPKTKKVANAKAKPTRHHFEGKNQLVGDSKQKMSSKGREL